MRCFKWKRILVLALGCVLAMASLALAAIPTIAVEELKPGMRGYGKTVIRGADIQTFDVEIPGGDRYGNRRLQHLDQGLRPAAEGKRRYCPRA
jgi:hypothetical protein